MRLKIQTSNLENLEDSQVSVDHFKSLYTLGASSLKLVWIFTCALVEFRRSNFLNKQILTWMQTADRQTESSCVEQQPWLFTTETIVWESRISSSYGDLRAWYKQHHRRSSTYSRWQWGHWTILVATRFPFPPHRRRACDVLSRTEADERWLQNTCDIRSGPQQMWAMGSPWYVKSSSSQVLIFFSTKCQQILTVQEKISAAHPASLEICSVAWIHEYNLS
jgi:hypothetical protein